MDIKRNIRLSSWSKLIKELGIIKNQGDITEHIQGSTGKTVTQAYFSNLVRGKAAIPDRVLHQISSYFYFTDITYLLGHQDKMINLHNLIKWICQKEQIHQKSLKAIPAPKLSQLKDSASNIEWNPVFEEINEKYGYRLNLKTIQLAENIPGLNSDGIVELSPQVKRIIIIAEHLIEKEVVRNEKEFAINILEVSSQTYYNLKSTTIQRDITKNMIVNYAKNYPKGNLRYLLLGEGRIDRLGSNDQLSEIIKRLNQVESRIL